MKPVPRRFALYEIAGESEWVEIEHLSLQEIPEDSIQTVEWAHFQGLVELCEELLMAVAKTKVKPVEDMALTEAWMQLHFRMNFYRPRKEKPVSETDEPSKSDNPPSEK